MGNKNNKERRVSLEPTNSKYITKKLPIEWETIKIKSNQIPCKRNFMSCCYMDDKFYLFGKSKTNKKNIYKSLFYFIFF